MSDSSEENMGLKEVDKTRVWSMVQNARGKLAVHLRNTRHCSTERSEREIRDPGKINPQDDT